MKKTVNMTGPPPALSLAGLPAGSRLSPLQHHYLQTVRSLEDLIAKGSRFDLRTFDARLRTSSELLTDLRERFDLGSRPIPRDLLMRLAEPATVALRNIADGPKVHMRRSYQQMMPAKVRIQDTRCLMKLARVPGRSLREKTSVAAKVPAVVRHRSVDTAENRLAKRVAVELGRAARARREYECEHPDLLSSDLDLLRDLESVCRRFDEGDFADVPPSVRVEPNNALLGHPDYNRIWRIFRMIRRREELSTEIWRRADEWIPRLCAWAVCSLLSASRNVTSTEGIVRTSFHGASPFEFVHGGVEFVVDPDHGTGPRTVTVRTEGRTVDIEISRLRGEGMLRPAGSERHSFQLDLRTEIPETWSSWRGLPLEVLGQQVNADNVYVWEGAADRSGIWNLARWICQCIGQPYESAGSTSAGRCLRELGFDLYGPTPVIAEAADSALTGEPAVAARVVDDDGKQTTPVPCGSSASSAVRGDWCITSLDEAVRVLASEATTIRDEHEHARKIVRHLLRGRMDLSSRLAVATPDDLDEVGMRALRAILPASSKTWLVWRSVAAAMGWRASGSAEAVNEGDVVLVVDAGAQACTASLLIGRIDTKDSEDAWYWERRAVFGRPDTPAPLLGTEGYLSEIGDLVCRGWDDVRNQADVRKRLLCEPRLHALIRDLTQEEVRVPCLDREGDLALASATVSEEVLSQLSRRVSAQLDDWLRAFVMELAALEQIQRHLVDSRLHVLLVGEPFSVVDATQLRTVVQKHIPAANCLASKSPATLAARGCSVFLDRHGRDLPTWRDIIPELHLLVSTNQGRRRIALLDEKQLKRGVRPGQILSHTSPETFQLPAGVDHLDLPLASGQAENRRVEMHTVVEHGSLPLPSPVEVRLHVHYRYAEDAFRVHLRPVNDAPFGEIEVRWSRGDVGSGGPQVRNLVPEFPTSSGWENCEPVIDRLEREYVVLFDQTRFFDPPKKKKTTTRNKIKGSPDEVLQQVDDLESHVANLTTILTEVLPAGRALADAPKRSEQLIAKCAALLTSLAGIQRDSIPQVRKRRGKDTKNPSPDRRRLWGIKQLLSESGSKAQRKVDDLEMQALISLSRLRSAVPRFAPEFVVAQIAAGEASARNFEALGRMFGSPELVSEDVFSSFLDDLSSFLDSQLEAANDLPGVRHRLWAMATAFWTCEVVVERLSEAQSDQLLRACQAVAEALRHDWVGEPVAIEIFQEWGLVLLALLRRRRIDDPPTGFLHALGETSRGLADLTEQIDRELQTRGYRPEPRVDFTIPAGADERSPFAAMLADTLRGHRVALIQLKED